MRKTILIVVLGILGSVVTTLPAQAQVTLDWVTITDVGNPAYQAPDTWRYTNNRGSVGYEYRIGTLELTTAQFLPFVQLFEDDLPGVHPTRWGAERKLDGTWALRTDVPNPGMLPSQGLSWEQAAMYVNWLQNGQQSDFASTQSGVYDVNTFTFNPDGTFNHVLEPAPGAKFWIPSLDEWLKAAHYDPDRYGPGQGGWWQYSNSSDIAPVPGLPGEGDTTAFVDIDDSILWDVPLGSYPHVQSPWGLLDLSGGQRNSRRRTIQGPTDGSLPMARELATLARERVWITSSTSQPSHPRLGQSVSASHQQLFRHPQRLWC